MPIQITQTKQDPEYNFEVTIEENKTKTDHLVSMSKEYFNNLKTNKQPSEIIQESFNFLLKKESKEQILSKFNITLISHYFPEFQKYIEDWSKQP